MSQVESRRSIQPVARTDSKRSGKRVGLFVISLMLFSTIAIMHVSPAQAQPTGQRFQYVVNIWMENKNYGDVLGGNACCSYENNLARNYSYATNYGQVMSANSLPEYLAFSGGDSRYSTVGASDCDPGVSPCPSGGFSGSTLLDVLDSKGLTFRGYAENYPVTQGCSIVGSSGRWIPRHFPWNYYSKILTNSTRCNELFGTTASTDNEFLGYLNQVSGWANFVWLTPNSCNDSHDSGCSASTGDSYLQALVHQILTSKMFATGQALLVITWDEYGPGPWIAAGPPVRLGYVMTTSYNHYNWLKTVEDNWGLPCITNECGLSNMFEFMTPSSNSFNPDVSCNPRVARTTDITDNMTGSASLNNSPFSPGITPPSGNSQYSAKRWLTAGGPTPPGWISPGPPCTITNSHSQVVESFVEIDNVRITAAYSTETDCSTKFNATNGGGTYTTGGTKCDVTANIYSSQTVSCAIPTDPGCNFIIHTEFDQDWQGAGYCGPSTVCDTAQAQSQITAQSTYIDVQGFVF